MNKLLMVAVATLVLVGCESNGSKHSSTTPSTGTTSMQAETVTATNLYGDYKLVQFDNELLKASKIPYGIAFEAAENDQIKVHGRLCNRFFGQATLVNGKLETKGLASTRMACLNEKDAAMEQALNEMFFNNDVNVHLAGSTLTLEGANHKFVYEKN